MKILLLVSSFNGLTQRAWCALREAGHDVSVELALDEQTIVSGVEAAKPDLVICPFLKERVPARVWRTWRTIIIHPGPIAERTVPGTGLQPMLRQVDRAFAWDDDAETIVRRIRAADGVPGVRTELGGLTVNAFDAHLGGPAGPPGKLLAHRDGAVLVGTG